MPTGTTRHDNRNWNLHSIPWTLLLTTSTLFSCIRIKTGSFYNYLWLDSIELLIFTTLRYSIHIIGGGFDKDFRRSFSKNDKMLSEFESGPTVMKHCIEKIEAIYWYFKSKFQILLYKILYKICYVPNLLYICIFID